MIAANDTFTSSHRTGRLHVWRTGEGHRAILTSAASKFPPKTRSSGRRCRARSGIRRDACGLGQDTCYDRQRTSCCR